jgi:N-acetylglutamate synthase-like GNAT family acetyltransferase
MLTVEPELQAKGIGAKLIARSEAEALQLNYTKLWMTVLSTRSELIAYYQRKGFELTGAKKPFPNDNKFGIAKQPLELLVMEKQLKQFVIV